MVSLWYFARFVLAWAWTLFMAGMSCLFLWRPKFAWTSFACPWGRVGLRLVGVRWVVADPHGSLAGPAVFICNHESLIDVVLMPAMLPRTVKFVAKKELRRIPVWGWALSGGGGLMIDRRDPRGAVAAIQDGLARMPRDWSVAVFPEGTRSLDGKMRPFKKGAFWIARERGLPIVPIGLSGPRCVVPKGGWIPRPTRVDVWVGAPLNPKDWAGQEIEAFVEAGWKAVVACKQAAEDRREKALAQQASRAP